jgi:hypothetical protein
LKDSQHFPAKNLFTIQDWISKQKVGKKVMAIRFCFLVKGKTYNDRYDEHSLTRTYSPLIRGYRNFTPGGVSYAHSWSYPNPENKSGKGILGKGWEPFNFWESDIKVKDWIEALEQNLIQPECGDILKQQVITPVEYGRNEEEIEEGILEISRQERNVFEGNSYEITPDILASYFPHNRKQCHFQFGSKCQYYDLCWDSLVKSDPLGNGYEVRVPHHDKEREVLSG